MRRGVRAVAAATALAGGVTAALWLWPEPVPEVRRPAAVATTSPPSVAAAPSRPAPSRRTASPAELRAEAVAVIAGRNNALQDRDERAWLADVDPGDALLRRRERQAFRTLVALPFERFSVRLDGDLAPVGDGRWAGSVLVTELLEGYDVHPATYRRHVAFVRRDGRLLLARTDLPASGVQPWELGPMDVLTGERTLLVGAGDPERLQEVVDRADAATAAVAAVWPSGWTRRVVVEVPRDQDEMARMLEGGPGADLDQIAAVAVTLGEASRQRLPLRVVVNPRATADLDGPGLEALLRHEITHVATGTGQDEVPIWLSEGFADYLAYGPLGLPVTLVADDLLDRAADEGPPSRLPDRGDFEVTSPRLAEAYEGAWLAVRLLVDDHGEAAVVRMYREAQTDGADQALREELGLSQADLLEDWQDAIEVLAGG